MGIMDRRPELPTDRVTRELRERIKSGEWSPGQRLPGVGDLAEHHKTSRATMSKVIARLAGEGLLTVVPSWGTFIPEQGD
jgi:DNA-binding GntR family transcriptional regulator